MGTARAGHCRVVDTCSCPPVAHGPLVACQYPGRATCSHSYRRQFARHPSQYLMAHRPLNLKSDLGGLVHGPLVPKLDIPGPTESGPPLWLRELRPPWSTRLGPLAMPAGPCSSSRPEREDPDRVRDFRPTVVAVQLASAARVVRFERSIRQACHVAKLAGPPAGVAGGPTVRPAQPASPDPDPGPYLRHWELQAPAKEMGLSRMAGTDWPAAGVARSGAFLREFSTMVQALQRRFWLGPVEGG